MIKNILIGIDVGSSNIKVVIFNSNFDILANEIQEYNTIVPKPSWTEYDPNEWWDGLKKCLNISFQKSGVDPGKIAGIGLSSLGCCPVPMDRNGNVVFNCIPWSDQRAHKEANFLVKNCKNMIFDLNKNYPTTLNSIPHLMWIKKNEPNIYKKFYKFTEPSGFLGQRLTGEFTMDLSFASSSDFGLDNNKLEWSEELIKRMGLDLNIYPRLHRNMESLGQVNKSSANELEIEEGIPVFAGGPDVTSAALAAGVLYPGQGFYSMGSGSNIMILTEDQDLASPYLLSIFHAKGPELRMLDGVQGSIGYSFRWLRDNLGGLEENFSKTLNYNTFDLMDKEAMRQEPGSGGLIYLPYLFGKFHPMLNPNARGIFFGLSPRSTRAHIIRAVMEGCCFDMYQSLKSALDIGLNVDEIVVTGGPSKSDLWCQILADVSYKKIITVNTPEASSFGDAILAGVGVGLFNSFEEIKENFIKTKKIFKPDRENHILYEELFTLFKSVYNNLLDDFEKLENIQSRYNLI